MEKLKILIKLKNKELFENLIRENFLPLKKKDIKCDLRLPS